MMLVAWGTLKTRDDGRTLITGQVEGGYLVSLYDTPDRPEKRFYWELVEDVRPFHRIASGYLEDRFFGDQDFVVVLATVKALVSITLVSIQ